LQEGGQHLANAGYVSHYVVVFVWVQEIKISGKSKVVVQLTCGPHRYLDEAREFCLAPSATPFG
jgi:hypothetical protein